MARVTLKDIVKRYDGQHTVIHGIDLEIADGEFVVFVGPSGCGKSTLLRMIAGLEDISAGELHIDGRLANQIPAAQRGLAMVFQSYALYPHMSVYENMAFALTLAGHKSAAIKATVERTAEVLQIGHLLQRKPKDLSGGQRQRVAIGRAIVRKPALFLFDEPLSNLDASLRVQMRVELSRLHKELGTTMIYVTHDQVEAMTLGQRIVVLNGGRVEQVGTPAQLYQQPANLFVAGFLGAPRMNLIEGTVLTADAGQVQLRLAGGAVLTVAADASAVPQGAQLTLGVRAEHLTVHPAGSGGANLVQAQVGHVEYLGDQSIVYCTLSGYAHMIAARQAADAAPVHAGQAIALHLPATRCHLFEAAGRALPGARF
ncbi:MAG: sn-glycerol-3-phosphate ABC transporter ATP-binding protein UgpC [Pseudomonadota bacterium]